MNDLVFRVTGALGASTALALGASLLWGVLSVLLSPCHLGMIPLVVGFVGTGVDGDEPGRAARLSFAFAGGMLVALAVLGLVVAAAGYAVQGFGAVTNYGVAALFLVSGLYLLRVVRLPFRGLSIEGKPRGGALAVALLGALFGIGLSPCTFAFLAPVLGVTFGRAGSEPILAAALFLAFGVGHCGLIGLAGSSADVVQRYLKWNARSKAIAAVKSLCGLLLLLGAGLLIYRA